ncbi:hypothetical protein BU26DRAFT_139524 [Trematosphaeria pertusa]|uniref:F-box domain-containing protein n=1 Tax=Trematosphaeria pertusa TaxID=390896 RepID=A0A6A6IX42_9PLEO|nr:uncharacterized protein BU26DRAFT_139524 [Trematosphaeria pertusa]KAF2254502.1 hypothetical protein BU26DRAFT_139524 [Trematosphaeria pertusa]
MMTNPNCIQTCSPRCPATPTAAQPSTALAISSSPRKSPRPSSSSRSPRNPVNTAWVQDQQRRVFLDHLTKWSLNHDSSAYFNGKISLLSPFENAGDVIELGKSVKCILTDSAWTDARKQIAIRLFPPRGGEGRYKMVVRCGAGWMSARDFFSKEYFMKREAEGRKRKFRLYGRLDDSLKWRSEVVPQPAGNTIVIRPLFLPFLRLPLELQQTILGVAAGKTGMYRPCRDSIAELPNRRTAHIILRNFYPRKESNIPLAAMFRISKELNKHLVPWVYRTTDFHFEVTGFTNFLWQAGPVKRAEIRHVTFRFSEIALLHCLRWLAPDPIFELFQPPVPTSPRGLQYLWRCQIQDYARELHLATLTLDIYNTPLQDIPFVVRILLLAFGSIRRIRFTWSGKEIDADNAGLAVLKERKSWREMSRRWYVAHRFDRQGLSSGRATASPADLEMAMDQDKSFFDRVEDDRGISGLPKPS